MLLKDRSCLRRLRSVFLVKIDKLAEEERKRKQEEERCFREEELREIAIKLRKKELEKRRLEYGSDSGDDKSENRSRERYFPQVMEYFLKHSLFDCV